MNQIFKFSIIFALIVIMVSGKLRKSIFNFKVNDFLGQKPGICPTSSGFGICVEACSHDFSCPGSYKCVTYAIFK